MTDTEYSDDERYANESFENETDTDVPEMSEVESETSVNSENDDEDDEDEDDLPSVKLNTGPIKRNSFSTLVTTIHKTDVVPFASSSDEEDDVIVGQTMAEINTPSMHLRDESPTPSKRHFMPQYSESSERLKSVEEETQESSEEISEEEDEDEEEFKRIKDMEEKYLQLNSGKISKENDQENQEENVEQEIDSEDESEEEREYENEETNGEVLDKKDSNSSTDSKLDAYYSLESLGENNIMQLLQSSMTNLKMSASLENKNNNSPDSETNQINERDDESINTNNIEPETIVSSVVNDLNSSDLSQSSSIAKAPSENQMTMEVLPEEAEKSEDNKESTKESNENKDNEVIDYKDDYEEEVEIEVDKHENSDHVPDAGSVNYDHDRDVYYDDHFDYRITSKTPTSFNSDEYIFHANFIKQFHRTSSTDKLRVKPHPRKSMSFSNERMREIERHNQILLRKILTQKPTYTLKNKPSQSSLQKASTQSSTRLTTSAVNRKKQQRQIDLDNQILKRKIEAIAMRRRPLIS